MCKALASSEGRLGPSGETLSRVPPAIIQCTVVTRRGVPEGGLAVEWSEVGVKVAHRLYGGGSF